MNIGVRGHDYGCASPEVLAARIAEAGFGCLQLALNKAIEGMKPEYGHLSPGLCERIRAAFNSRGLSVAVLGCYIDPASPDDSAREAGVKRFLECAAYCRALGSWIVATETSHYSGSDAGREAQYQRLLNSVKRMVAQAERFGVFAGIEPVKSHTLNTPRMARRLLDDIGSDNLQIVLDPINLLSPDTLAYQRELIDECFEMLGDRIVCVHAKDVYVNSTGAFAPCVIGEGAFDHKYFYDKLARIKPGICVLREEAKPESAARDLAALKKFISEAQARAGGIGGAQA